MQDRINLLSALVPALPSDRLHLIPTLVTEAVLGTKEVNEKARNAAFDLLVIMAKKMAEGGTIDQKLMKGDGVKGGADDDAEMEDVEGGMGSSTGQCNSSVLSINS